MNETNASPSSEGPSHPAPQEIPDTAIGAKLPKIVRFNDLAPCGDELWIENNGQIYRLRRTKQGKLILTK